ncbi:MAG: hypothetical protein NWF10_05470 [Candidatus Bathyarchaeota archaeon]|nr:hypothetical protein [Candidatus Bathyarchaeota archaeon]
MFVYCNTKDSPRTVGEVVCRANFVEDSDRSWIIRNEGDSCVIKANSNGHCVAVVYCVGDSVVGIEIDDNCASKVVEPLIEKYSFEKVKWLLSK